MTDVIFVLKTSNFEFDQRVHKEATFLISSGYKVGFYLYSGDVVSDSHYPNYNFFGKKIWQVNRSKRSVRQYLCDLMFQFRVLLSLLVGARSGRIVWLCDPIMFPLVYMLSLAGYKTIWDHHELPPHQFLKYRVLKWMFGHAYKRANINIHANNYRQQFLEQLIGVRSARSFELKNLPSSLSHDEDIPAGLSREFNITEPFVYLQNAYTYERGVDEIFHALNAAGINVVCAGDMDEGKVQEIIRKYPGMASKLTRLGYLKLSEINWLLARCYATIILYRNTSMNQWYCDPNRLYQAINKGCAIITGSNPTIESVIKNVRYERCVLLSNDGCSSDKILNALLKIGYLPSQRGEVELPIWDSYKDSLAALLNEIVVDK